LPLFIFTFSAFVLWQYSLGSLKVLQSLRI